MGANLEYQFQNLTGGIDNVGQGHPAGGNVAKHRGEAVNLAALKPLVKYWGGLALLVSLGVVGIPFVIYFVIGAVSVLLG